MTDPAEVPVRRALEIEDPTNVYVVHAIANRLTLPFARMGISPNAVSLAGMMFGILAGVAYHRYPDRGFVLLGFVLMIGWHVMDGVDGQLARLTRTHSEFGKVIDGVCDYTTFGAVYVGLGLTLAQRHGAWVWALILVAGICHAVQSAIYELQRERYGIWGRGSGPAVLPAPVVRPRDRDELPVHRFVADKLLRIYLRIQQAAMGDDAEAGRRFAAILAARPDVAPERRQAYRATFAPCVRAWSVMSANTRTIAIFLFAASGWAIGFFWFEIFGLGAVLAFLLHRQRARTEGFVRSLETAY